MKNLRFLKTQGFLRTLLIGLTLSMSFTLTLGAKDLVTEEIEQQKSETESEVEQVKEDTKDELLREPVRDERKKLRQSIKKKMQWKKLF